MRYYFEDARAFYNNVEKLCKKNAYNLVLHKHLGDIFYAIAAKPFFETQYKAPLHFIIRPQHEFLMKMLGVKNYAVYDIDALVKKNTDFKELYFNGAHHDHFADDRIENEMFQALFPCIPANKGVPFVCENLINNFFTYDDYWAYRWSSNMGLDTNFRFLLPQHKLDLSDAARRKISKIAPLDKIVLIAPEAATFPEFGPEFWNIIADVVHAHGYTIIVNSKKFKINHGVSAFDMGLSLSDVVALGLNCAYVFSLRSGLCDVLVGCGKRLYAFYPAQGRRELHSLTVPFVQQTGVHEIQIGNWKIDSVVWDGVDLTKALQKYVSGLYRNYILETMRRALSFGHHKAVHTFRRNLARDLAGVSRLFPENNIQNPVLGTDTNLAPIYNKKTKNIANVTVQKESVLGGLITFKRDSHGVQILRVCGIVVYSKKNKNGVRISRMFSIPFHRKNLRQEMLAKITRDIGNDVDDIYIMRHNIGETYVFLTHLKNWIKRNGSVHPVVLVWREKDIPLYEMFLPKNIGMHYVPITTIELSDTLGDEVFEYNGHRIFCPTPVDIVQYMLKQRESGDPNLTFYTYICKYFLLDSPDKLARPIVPQSVRDDVRARIATYFRRPFVVIMPNANSLGLMPVEFWNKIIHEMDVRGYDVFVNMHHASNVHETGLNLSSAIMFDCNIAEIYELARNAAGIITLASGLAVLMTATNTQMDLIYTDCKYNVKADTMQALYSVYSLPGVNPKRVREYDANIQSPDALADLILSRYPQQ